MIPVRRVALGGLLYAVLAPLFLFLWLLLLTGIGELDHSGVLGVCGPYGPMGTELTVVLFVGAPVVLVGAGLVARRILRLVHRRRPEREPAASTSRR